MKFLAKPNPFGLRCGDHPLLVVTQLLSDLHRMQHSRDQRRHRLEHPMPGASQRVPPGAMADEKYAGVLFGHTHERYLGMSGRHKAGGYIVWG